jgi:hypothetical protein
MISPWKFGWLNPSTMSCTGPMAMTLRLFSLIGSSVRGLEVHHPAHHRSICPAGGPRITREGG